MPPALHLFHAFFPDHHPSPWDRRFGCISTLLRIFDNHRPPHLLRRRRRRRRCPDLDAAAPQSSELQYSKSAAAHGIIEDSRRRHGIDVGGPENNTTGDGDDFCGRETGKMQSNDHVAYNYAFHVDDYHSGGGGAAHDYCSRSTPGSPRHLRSYVNYRATADRQLWPNHNNGSGGRMMEPDDGDDDLRIIDVVPARASVDGVPASYFMERHHERKESRRRDRSGSMIVLKPQESVTSGQHLRCRTSKASTDMRQQGSVAGHGSQEYVHRNRAPSDRHQQMVDPIFGEPPTKESAGARRTPKQQQQQTLPEKLSTSSSSTTSNNHGTAPPADSSDRTVQKFKDSAQTLAKLQLMTQNLRQARHTRRQQQLPSFPSSNYVDGSSLIGRSLCSDAGNDDESYYRVDARKKSTAAICRRSKKPPAAATVVDDHDNAGAKLINAFIKDRELFHSARHDHTKFGSSSSSSTASAVAPQRNSSFDYSEAARVSQRMQELDVSAPRRSLDGGSTAAEHRHRSGTDSKSVLRLREAVLSRFFTANNQNNNSSSSSIHQGVDHHPRSDAATGSAAANPETRRNVVPSATECVTNDRVAISATKPTSNVIARLMGLEFEQPKINRGAQKKSAGDVKNYDKYSDAVSARVPPNASAGRRLVPAPDWCRNHLSDENRIEPCRYGVTSNREKTHAADREAVAGTEDGADVPDHITSKATCKSISRQHNYIINEATCKSIIRQQHDYSMNSNGDAGYFRQQDIRLTPWPGGRLKAGRNLSTETQFSLEDTTTETASGDELAAKSMSFREMPAEITEAVVHQSTTQVADKLCADKHCGNYGKRPKYRRSCDNAGDATKCNRIDGADQDQLPILPSTDYNYIIHRSPDSRRRRKKAPAVELEAAAFRITQRAAAIRSPTTFSSVTRNNDRSAAVSAEANPSPAVDQHRLSQLVSTEQAAELDHDGAGSRRSRKSRSLLNTEKATGDQLNGSSSFDRRRRSSGAQTSKQNSDDCRRCSEIEFGQEACRSDKHRRRLTTIMNRKPEIVFDIRAQAEEVNPEGNSDRRRSSCDASGIISSASEVQVFTSGEERIRRTETGGTEENESPVSVLEADRNYHLYDNVSSSASTHSDSSSVITDDSDDPRIRLITFTQLRRFLAAVLPRFASHPRSAGPHVRGGSVDRISRRFSAEIPSPAVVPAATKSNEREIHLRTPLPDSFRSLDVNNPDHDAAGTPSFDRRLISDYAADMLAGIETWLLGHALYAPMFAKYHYRHLIGSPADILHQIRQHPSSSSSSAVSSVRHLDASATRPDHEHGADEMELEEWDGIINGSSDAIGIRIDGGSAAGYDGVQVVVSAKGLMAAVWRRLKEVGSKMSADGSEGLEESSAGSHYKRDLLYGKEGGGEDGEGKAASAVVRNAGKGGRKVVKVVWRTGGADEVMMKVQMAAAERQGRSAAAAAEAAVGESTSGGRGGAASASAGCYGGWWTYVSVALAVENSVMDDLLLDVLSSNL